MFAIQRISSYVIAFTFFSAFFLTSFSVSAQAPESINYQAIARNSSGIVLEDQMGTVTFTILSGSISGTEVYKESHFVTTNSFGLFNVKIGKGTNSIPTKPFSAVDWGNNSHYLNVVIDFFGPEDLGTTELVSVPYALYAKSSGNKIKAGRGIEVFNNDSIVNVGDTSSSNELIDSLRLVGKELRIFENSISKNINLTSILGVDSLLSLGDTAIQIFNADLSRDTIQIKQGVYTQIDSTAIDALGFVAGPHTIDTDTQLDSLGITTLGFVAGANAQIDSTGIDALGFVAGPHTIDTDTQIDSTGIDAFGFTAGPHTIDTDTQLVSLGITNLGFVAGADTQIDSTGIDALGFV
ncbi:MAG: hypothetical protein JKY48_11730, partial [Flavobacteriales bacterium]|nr:hypothetical protein [Flavobacteriales bacterium]